mgnify:CR=1 FL=1
MHIKRLTLLATMLLCGLVQGQESTTTVEKFIGAFNRHDVDAMLALSAPDIHWMSISRQQLAIETSTQASLRDAMVSYFESMPSARSRIRSIHSSGEFVYTLEQAVWQSNGVEKSQCSVAVYELREQKIVHVWYFPAHRCTG